MPSAPLYITNRPQPKVWIAATAAMIVLLALPSILPPDGATHAGQFAGRFHVGLIHLPIGLLLLLPVLEIVASRRPALREAAHLTLWIAAATAVFSSLLGILLAHAGAFTEDQVHRHLWSGIALTLAVLLFALLRPVLKTGASIALALLLAGGTAWTAHTGGAIVYGGRWLVEFAPHPGNLFGTSRNNPPVAPDGFYAQQVQPILNGNCVSCHGPRNRKGNLRLDSYAHLMDGGASGDIVSPGHPEHSILLHRITLPLDDPKLMPKKGDPLSPQEVETLRVWIAAGASSTAIAP